MTAPASGRCGCRPVPEYPYVAHCPLHAAAAETARRLAEVEAEMEQLTVRFEHLHVAKYSNGDLLDECRRCGLDLRHTVHTRAAIARAEGRRSP